MVKKPVIASHGHSLDDTLIGKRRQYAQPSNNIAPVVKPMDLSVKGEYPLG